MCGTRPARRRAGGFTLIELLVVVAIIALLVGILLPALGSARDAARSAVCLSNARQLALSITMYAESYKGEVPRSQHSSFAHGTLPWEFALHDANEDASVLDRQESWPAYVESRYRCPSDPRRRAHLDADPSAFEYTGSYALNVYYELSPSELAGERSNPKDTRTWRRIDSVPMPHATVLMGEINETVELAGGATGMTRTDHIMAHFWTTHGAPPEIARERHGTRSSFSFLDGRAELLPLDETFEIDSETNLWNPEKAH